MTSRLYRARVPDEIGQGESCDQRTMLSGAVPDLGGGRQVIGTGGESHRPHRTAAEVRCASPRNKDSALVEVRRLGSQKTGLRENSQPPLAMITSRHRLTRQKGSFKSLDFECVHGCTNTAKF